MTNYCGVPAGLEDEEEYDGYDGNDSDITFIGSHVQNLKIKIVPKITSGAGLGGADFDCTLTELEESWFENLRAMWNTYKNTPPVQQHFNLNLLQNSQPLLLALKMFANCPECTNLKKKDLAVFILQTTCDLHKTHPKISSDCDNNTRMVAFNFVKTSGVFNLYKAVIETFELYIIIDFLIPKLKEMVIQGYYKDVAYWAIYLKATQSFDIFDIVFPLILQDKVYIAEEYLNSAKDQQLAIIEFLDSLLDKQKTVSHHCEGIFDKYKYKDVQHNVLNYRHISKLLNRLATKYKIDSELTPNYNFTKNCSYMHYLYHKYQDGGMGLESWRELICDTATTPSLQQHLVTHIATYDNIGEALYWLDHFQIFLADLPSHISAKLRESPKNSVASDAAVDIACMIPVAIPLNSNNTANPDEFLRLDLPENCIILVDNNPKFLDMISYLKQQTLIAFDSEWKPSPSKDSRVSLLQLATTNRVFLVDCISSFINECCWKKLGHNIFNNLEIFKIGFSIAQDISILNKSLPLQLNLRASSCYLDLRDMWRRLKYMQIVTFPYGNALHVGESLCALTELCLGKKLDKSNQCSNWTKRPLRDDQIAYAALDSHCLLQIYNVFNNMLQQMGLDIHKVIDELTTSKAGYANRVKQHALVTEAHANSNAIKEKKSKSDNEFSWATDIKFICDYMLVGLVKELRKLGIDCVDIKPSDIDFCIDLAKRENRYVLTGNHRYEIFVSKLSKSQCYHIPTDSNVHQVLNLLNIFDIRVHKNHLFTRCLQCNGNEFILIEKDHLRVMCRKTDNKYSNERQLFTKQKMPTEKTFQLVNANDHIIHSKTTFSGKSIKLYRIKRHILETHKHFYVCDNCGSCTWEGAHPLHSSITEIIVKDA